MRHDNGDGPSSPLWTRRTLISGLTGASLLANVPLVVGAAPRNVAKSRGRPGLDSSLKDVVVEGRFGTALNAAWTGGESARPLTAYKALPLTVEFWCKLDPDPLFYNFTWTHNVLVANEPRESADHWSLYLEPLAWIGTPPAMTYGTLSAYLPGMYPEVIKSSKLVADGKWHYVAMVLDHPSVALYADGQLVGTSVIARKPGGIVIQGKLTVGKAVLAGGGTLDFNGAIDDLRLSQGVRAVSVIPTTPLPADPQTVGLWSFDCVEGATEFADASAGANAIQVIASESLDQVERVGYKAGFSPQDSDADSVSLKPGAAAIPSLPPRTSLNGLWQLLEGATAEGKNPITASVPGSVHTALHAAGVIPFPYIGRNQEIAAVWSQKAFTYVRTFPRPPAGQDRTLAFEGISNRCTVSLNGHALGQHEGMFTRFEFPVHELLQDTNTLVVRLEPATDWRETVAAPIFYGSYYCNIPPLGIWKSVDIHGEPSVRIRAPFVATRCTKTGLMDLVTSLSGPTAGWSGRLVGVISPENFSGQSYTLEYPICSGAPDYHCHLQFSIPNPQLWWPVDIGKPNLYRLTLSFIPSNGDDPDVKQITFGIRTVRMGPLNEKPRPRLYNWTFVINERPLFIKGSNWCTPDAMMDLSRPRYERLLDLAARQHIQMLRCWGYGIVETDDFYDLCDRMGIMVMLEWPTTWDSHNEQPLKLLEEVVRDNTLRLRNHPSLVMYCGGNESKLPFGPAVDMMGRLSIELDGTRAFHRGEPRGGASHDYREGRGIDEAFTMQALFYGEVGFSFSYPNYESVRRFLPVEEQDLWPAPPDGTLAYKTSMINSPYDWSQMRHDAEYFTEGATMERFIIGTQLAQAVGVRHIMERARARWPDCSGALYFKFNEIAPTAERTSVDWYGSPKLPYYLIQDSFAPLLAVALFPKATTHGDSLTLPILLLDDAHALGREWEVVVRAYRADLTPIKASRFTGSGPIERVVQLGDFTLTAEQTKTAPLFVVTEVKRNGKLAKRNYYFTNFAVVRDCLFNLPGTSVSLEPRGDHVSVRNDGKVPAVGVDVFRPRHLDTFLVEDGYFWLEPGEVVRIAVSTCDGLHVRAWNSPTVGP